MKKIIPVILAVINIFVLVFVPVHAIIENKNVTADTGQKNYNTILTLWQIDTFEGGINSRQDFLMRAALLFEKTHKGALVSVVNHTEQSAEESLGKGIIPDMLSYGTGVDFAAGYCKELKGVLKFAGGEYGGKYYAVPWCRGGYYLISKNILTDSPIEKLIISKGGYNNPYTSLALGNIKAAEYEVKEPLAAYTAFLSGMNKGEVLLGTQRDIFRLNRRGIETVSAPLSEFSDIYQYVSVFSSDAKRYSLCSDFIDCLLSDGAQEKLNSIGMCSVTISGLYGDYPAVAAFESKSISYTLSAFSTKSANAEIENKSKLYITEENIDLNEIKLELKQLK